MEEQRSFSDRFLDSVMKIVYKILRKENLLQSEFHLGKVESVINSTKLRAYIDGGTTPQLVYSNPNVMFEVGDEIFILFVNRDSKSKYAISKRALDYEYPKDLISPHQIILSNENQSIPADSTGKTKATIDITSTVDTFKGNERIAGNIGFLVLKDTNDATITVSGVTLNKQDPTDTESGTITMSIDPSVTIPVDSGYIEIPIIIEGNSYIKKLSWNKSKDGQDGQDGYTPVKGTDYFDGENGQDGISSYLWIRYSQNANGNPMTTDPTGAKYIGTATTSTDSAPTGYTSYIWTLIKGTDGIPGEKGDNGLTSYLHIKYSDDGFSFTANNGEVVGQWIGTYVDFTQADSATFTDYTWNKVKGEDGYTPIKGVDYFDGTDGQNGQSSYLWVRYSQNSNGNPMTTSPSGSLYIGVATTTNAVAPESYTSYQWSLIKGTDGVKGETGADGKTSYLHIKYSSDAGTTFTANNGEDVGEWIGTYVDFTQTDSTNVASYTWNKVKGDDAYYVIVTGEQIFKHNSGTSTPTNTTIKLTAAPFNIDNPSYIWQYWNTTSWVNLSKTGYNTAVYTVAYNDTEWAINDVIKRYRCLVNGSYSDEITISKLYDGERGNTGDSALSIILTNESHTIPTDSNGENGDYVGSGTQIYLYEGTTALTYNGTGTTNGTWKITASGSGISPSTTFTDSGSYVTVGNHSNMTENTATVTYTIIGKRNDGTPISLTKTQTLSKTKTGVKGDNGSDAKVADILASSQIFKSTDGITFTPNSITLTPSLQNVTFSKWQYSTNGGTSFTDAVSGSNGITISSNILTIANNSTLFTTSVTSVIFKLITNTANVSDVVTIVKLSDGVKGDQGIKGDNGANGKVADILASTQTFKSTDNGVTYTPSSIVLTPSLQVVTFSKWQYSTNGGTSFTDVVSGQNGLTVAADKKLTIASTSSLFTSTVTTLTFKLVTNDVNVYDTMTIVKLYDVNMSDYPTKEDLRLTGSLPTTITQDANGITAYTSDPNKYARLDYRGLYVKGGAIQIDGGLSDSQIAGATGWNKQGTYIDDNGIYTGKINFQQGEGTSLKLGQGLTHGDGDLQIWVDSDGDGIKEIIGRVDWSGAYYPYLKSDNIVGNVVNKWTGGHDHYYFHTVSGNDQNDGTTDYTTNAKKNPQAFIDSLPKNLNTKAISIHFRGDIKGGLYIEGFYNGNIEIIGDDTDSTKEKIYGTVYFRNCSTGIFVLKNCDIIYDSASTELDCGVYCSSVSQVLIHSVKVYGGGIQKHGYIFSNTRFRAVENHVYNITDRGLQATNVSYGYMWNNHGVAPIAILVDEGSFVTGTGSRWSGSFVRWSNAIIGTVNTAGTGWTLDPWTIDTAEGTPPTPPAPAEKSLTVSANSGDNYSSSGYWTNDEVKQGNYGYGERYGVWYFDLSAIKGKTVVSATLTVRRNSGAGASAARTMRIVSYRNGTRATRTTTLNNSSNVKTASIAIGQTVQVDVTSLLHNNIAQGLDNTIGVYNPNGATDYMSLETTPTLSIKYK